VSILKRIFGICETGKPEDTGAWKFSNGKVEIEWARVPELRKPCGAVRLEGRGLPIIHEAKKPEPEEPLPTGSEHILFIDDQEVLVEIASQMLEQLGYEVVTKQSSTEALALQRYLNNLLLDA
jgi:hypothetical protein